MHFLVGAVAVVTLVWFAFGEQVARTVVGVGLAVFSSLALLAVCTMLGVVHRDNAEYTRQHSARQSSAPCYPDDYTERCAASWRAPVTHPAIRTYEVPVNSGECYSHNSDRIADINGNKCTITEYTK